MFSLPKFFFLSLLFIGFALPAQEVCDNGLDDDGDGLIDLNDTTDCNCLFVSVVESLFPNPSFDEFSNDPECASNQSNGAPDGPGQANCIAGWQQASEATTDAWHLLTYNGNPPNWPGAIPQPIPSGVAVAGFFTAVESVDGYREYFGACLPDGPTVIGEQYRLNIQLGFGEETTNGIDELVSSPETIELAIYGVLDCNNIPFASNQCPEVAGATGWELVTTFMATATAVPGWEEVVVDFTTDKNYAALAFGGTCDPVNIPPEFSLFRHYYFVDDIILNTVEVFENTLTVGGISVEGEDICGDDARMFVQPFDDPDATYQWYRNGVAIPGATGTEYFPPLDEDFNATYTCRIITPSGCGVAGPVELIRPVVSNAFQDSVFFCNGFVEIIPNLTGGVIQSYLWDDGSIAPTLVVTEEGTYSVTVTSFCEEIVETIVVTSEVEPSFEWVVEPEAYCAGDTMTTYFSTDWQIQVFVIGLPGGNPLGVGDTAMFILNDPVFLQLTEFGLSCFPVGGQTEFLNPFLPNVAIQDGVLSCNGEPFVASVTGVGFDPSSYDFEWLDESGNTLGSNETIEINERGNYSLSLLPNNGTDCPFLTNFSVSFPPGEEQVTAAEVPTLNCSVDTAILAVTLRDSINTQSVWSFGGSVLATNTADLTVSEAGEYELDLFLLDALNPTDTLCRQAYTYTVVFEDTDVPVDLQTRVDDECQGTYRVDLIRSTELAAWEASWFENDSLSPFDLSTDSLLHLAPGNYSLRLERDDGLCSQNIPFELEEIELLVLDGEILSLECTTPERPLQSGGVVAMPGNGVAPYEFYLLDDRGVKLDSNLTGTFVNLPEGDYQLEVIDEAGCTAIDSSTLNIRFPEPLIVDAGSDQIIKLGESGRLRALTVGPVVDSVIWSPRLGLSCTDCLNPVVTPLENNVYTVTVISSGDGCPTIDSVFVGVDATGQVYVPNAFSPNGDGINDDFLFFPDQSYAELLEFRVYDQWGGEVFVAENALSTRAGWDGMSVDGKPSEPGVYVYLLRVKLLNGEERKLSGAVNLLR